MTTNQKILAGCGGILAFFALIFVIMIVWLATLPEGGVKLSNEMESYATDYLDEHAILEDGEKVVAYYDVTVSMDGTEAAILTNRRVIYHKNGRNDIIPLADINDVQHREEPLVGDVIEIYSTDGSSMKIEVAPFNGGQTFLSSLNKGWENAGGGPKKE